MRRSRHPRDAARASLLPTDAPSALRAHRNPADGLSSRGVILELLNSDLHVRNVRTDEFLAIVRGACAGVGHLHAHGYVHGDVCPGNLLVHGAGHVTLIDLGVARRAGEAGAVRGTHAYMAPEQVRGEAWTPATDVFALGVVLWELVAGARLFHRGPPWLTMAAVVEQPVPKLTDSMLDAIAQAALAKDPAQRTPSTAALLDALSAN